jgi:cytidylate kinase
MDGGAAVGKSSTSRGLAERLGLMHVDTGAHYRTLTHALLRTGADPEQPESIPAKLAGLKPGTRLEGRSAKLSINGGVPADADIRSPEVNAAVSKFAALPPLRDFLFEYQRSQAEVARERGYAGLIMEGRDIGSVIFPDAEHRFFLHADEATRAARRAKEGQTDSIAARDKMDQSRKTAPLHCPEGATRIDTGSLTLEEVVDKIAALITEDRPPRRIQSPTHDS